jgi:hypothetical protein
MVEDVEAEAEEGSASSALLGGSERGSGTGRASGAAAQAQALNTPRVAFQIVPAAQALPPQVGTVERLITDKTGAGSSVDRLEIAEMVGSM